MILKTFIQQGCIKLITSDSKDIYNFIFLNSNKGGSMYFVFIKES